MFEGLSEKLSAILDGLTRRGALSEDDVNAALREVRRALLEADVALEVVRSFTDKVRSRAVGAEVVKSVTPGQMVVKIVHDSAGRDAGHGIAEVDRSQRRRRRCAIMLVGLQGLGQDDDGRQDRQAGSPTRARQAQGADGLARREAGRLRMEQLASARPSRSSVDNVADRLRASRSGRRSPSAP